ncbi:MAG: host attachment protein [Rhodospirillaceae bacterium]|nr:host attachment protein [Rhodospirillaceae bacterium]
MIFDRDRAVWLVVADSVSTRIYHIHFRPFRLSPVPSDAIQGLDTVVQDLESDTHGGAQRHRKEVFARKIAHVLNTACDRGLFADLILVAPAVTLGDIRHTISPAAHKAVILEIAGDWIGLSETEVFNHLKHHLMPLATA